MKPGPDTTSIFNALQGEWRMHRSVSGYGRMAGTAVFHSAGESTLHYREDVEVRPDGRPAHPAFREYIYRLDNAGIEVRFADGRPFHRLVFKDAARATGHHDCAPDAYDADYEFKNADAFTIRWIVKGPRKDYISQTRYTREPD